MDQFEVDARIRTGINGRSPTAIFLDASRRRILTDLVVHVTDGAGPLLLVGDAGSGKTTLLRRVAEEAAAQDVPVIFPADAADGSARLLAMLAACSERLAQGNAGADAADQPVVSVSAAPLPQSATSRPTAILIDDAEAYSITVWHQLASILRSGSLHTGMPAVILAVASDMLDWLNSAALLGDHAANERIRRLHPLALADVPRYIAHRLKAERQVPPGLIPPAAMAQIAAATDGLPGPITRLCDELLALPSIRNGGGLSAEAIASLAAGLANAQPETPPGSLPGSLPRAIAAEDPAAAPIAAAVPPAADVDATKPAWADIPPRETAGDPPSPNFAAAKPAWAYTAARDGADFTTSPPRGVAQAPRPSPFYDERHRGGTLFQRRRRRRWPKLLMAAGAVTTAAVAAVALLMALHARRADDTIAATATRSEDAARPSPTLTPPHTPTLPTLRGDTSAPQTDPAMAGQGLPTMPLPRATAVPRSDPLATASPPTAPAPAPALAGEERRGQRTPPPTPNVAARSAPAAAPGAASGAASSPPAAAIPSPSRRPGSTAETKAAETKAAETSGDKPGGKASAAGHGAAAGKPSGKGAKTAPAAGATPAVAESNGGDADAAGAPTPPRPVSEVIAMGDEFRASGDVPWARKFYQAAQDRGSAKATAALAQTYDPRYVNNHDHPDPAMARQLYDEAARHGDGAAAKQLEELDRWLDEGH